MYARCAAWYSGSMEKGSLWPTAEIIDENNTKRDVVRNYLHYIQTIPSNQKLIILIIITVRTERNVANDQREQDTSRHEGRLVLHAAELFQGSTVGTATLNAIGTAVQICTRTKRRRFVPNADHDCCSLNIFDKQQEVCVCVYCCYEIAVRVEVVLAGAFAAAFWKKSTECIQLVIVTGKTICF